MSPKYLCWIVFLLAVPVKAAEPSVESAVMENPVPTVNVTIWRPKADAVLPAEISAAKISPEAISTAEISADQVEPYPNVQVLLTQEGTTVARMTTDQQGTGYAQNIAAGEGKILAENSDDNRFGSRTIQIQYPRDQQAEYQYLLTDSGLYEWNPETVLPNGTPYQYIGSPGHRHAGWLGLAGLAGLAGLGNPVSPSAPE